MFQCLFGHKWKEIVARRGTAEDRRFLIREEMVATVEECGRCHKRRAFIHLEHGDTFEIHPAFVLDPCNQTVKETIEKA